MKMTLIHLAAGAILAATAPSAAAQAIDMSQSHSAILSKSSPTLSDQLEPAVPHHVKVPIWTRMVAHQDTHGQLRAICTVEPIPHASNPHTPPTNTLPSQQ